MRISGSGGRVRVGYQLASHVGSWTLTRVRVSPTQVYTIEAALVDLDTFWGQQRPMDLDLTIGSRHWAWTSVQPDIHGESLTATLTGPPSIH